MNGHFWAYKINRPEIKTKGKTEAAERERFLRIFSSLCNCKQL